MQDTTEGRPQTPEITSNSVPNENQLANTNPLEHKGNSKLKLFLMIEVIIITALLVLVSFALNKAVIEPSLTVASAGIEKFVGDLVNIPTNEVVITNQQDFYSAKPKANEVIVYKNLGNMQQGYNLRWLVDNKLVELRVDFSHGRSVEKQLLMIIIDGGPGGTENSNEAIPLSIFKDERIQSTVPETLQPGRSCITIVSDLSCREFTNQPDGLIAISVRGGDESGNFHTVMASFEKSKLPYDTGTASSRAELDEYSLNGFFSLFTRNIKLLPIVILFLSLLPLSVAAVAGYILAKKLFTTQNLLSVNVVFLPLAIVLIPLNYLFVVPVIGTLIEILFH